MKELSKDDELKIRGLLLHARDLNKQMDQVRDAILRTLEIPLEAHAEPPDYDDRGRARVSDAVYGEDGFERMMEMLAYDEQRRAEREAKK